MAAMLIRRYVLGHVIKAFLAALAVLYSVMFIVQWVKLSGLLSAGDVDILLLALVPMAVFVIPMALLFGVLIVLENLSADSEIVAMKACGLNTLSWSRPVILFAVICMFVHIMIATQWGPDSMKAIQRSLAAGASERIYDFLKERDFNDTFNNTIIYVESIDRDDEILQDVFIESVAEGHSVITAEYGKIAMVAGNIMMLLANGSIFREDGDVARYIKFKEYLFTLEAELSQEIDIRSYEIANQQELQAMIDRWAAPSWVKEYHDRYAFPVLNVILVLVALTFGIQKPRSAKFTGFIVGVATILGYYLIFILSDRLVKSEQLSPILGAWLPNIFFVTMLVFTWILRRFRAGRGHALG